MNIKSSIAQYLHSDTLEAMRQTLTQAQRQLQTNDIEMSAMRESLNETAQNESISELELALDEVGWRRMSLEGEREFSRAGLRTIQRICRIMFLKNPLVNRSVTLQAMYVWAQGCSITSPDAGTQKAIDEIMSDRLNKQVIGTQGRALKEQELQVLGNLFFFFPRNGAGRAKIRSIPADEITDIVMNPEDGEDAWLYRRVWVEEKFNADTATSTGMERTAYYPAMGADEQEIVSTGRTEVIPTAVYHIKVGCLSDMKFGVPEVYQGIDWARAYKGFLEDWTKIVKSYARFAWNLQVGGGKKQIAAAAAQVGTQIATGNGSAVDTNPSPVGASMFVNAGGAKLEAIRTSGATTSADDSRRLLLMYCASCGFAEHFFGDLSTGNLATAKTLDRPTELKILDRQKLWAEALSDMLRYMVSDKIKDAKIEVTFPPILEHDITETINAIVSGATLEGHPMGPALNLETVTRLLLKALEVKDPEPIIKQVLLDAEAAKEEAAQLAQDQGLRQQGAPPKVNESLRGLTLAIQEFGSQYGPAFEALREKEAA